MHKAPYMGDVEAVRLCDAFAYTGGAVCAFLTLGSFKKFTAQYIILNICSMDLSCVVKTF